MKPAFAAAPGAAPPPRRHPALAQASMAVRVGNAVEAEQFLRTHLLQAPGDVEALAMLSDIVAGKGLVKEAELLLRRALALAPEAHSLRLALARVLRDAGDQEAALEQLQLLPARVRASPDIAAVEAMILGVLGRRQEEVALLEKLVIAHPGNPRLWTTLGTALNYVGRFGDAVEAMRKAIAIRPTFGEAWWSLSNLKSFRFEARDISAMRKALRGQLDESDQLHLHFALGKALEDRGEWQGSFRHYSEGNRIRATSLRPEQMSVTAVVDEALRTFTTELFEQRRGQGHEAKDPIFVVGLQRSGSTLIEQILATHPLIEGTSELVVFNSIAEELRACAARSNRSLAEELRLMDPSTLRQIGTDYLEGTRKFRQTDRPFFVDKLPGNWLHIGLIRLALPNAKIVDARRHPLACGFSNFKQHYASGVGFSFSLESIGHFYADYLRQMRHFDRLQPGSIHHVINERLIEDSDGEVRRLLEFVGVPFDSACLEPHRNMRAVHTPSAEQVRRPINRDGVDYWRNYERWLDPLKGALGSARDEWDSVD